MDFSKLKFRKQFNKDINYFEEFVNDKEWRDYDDNDPIKQNWAAICRQFEKIQRSNDYARSDSDLWTSDERKQYALKEIREYKGVYGVQPLFDFEIYILNKGFDFFKGFKSFSTYEPFRMYKKDNIIICVALSYLPPKFRVEVHYENQMKISELPIDRSMFDDYSIGNIPKEKELSI